MRRVERSALMPYPADAMFTVVNDVASYPGFLPWCTGSEVLSESPQEVIARLDLAGAGIRKSFTTRNRLQRPDSISMSLVEGPFSSLDGQWRFIQMGDTGSKIEMVLVFDMDNRMMNFAFSRVFDAAARKMVEAFCRRADHLYG